MSRFIPPYADVGKGITPSDGAQLFFFATGTSTPQNTYADEALTTPNTNPVIADSNGLFGSIFIKGIYNVVLKDKNGVQQWQADPVGGSLAEFDTLSDAVSADPLIGLKIRTYGYSSLGDYGGTDYVVVSAGTGVADGGSFIDTTTNQLKAIFQPIISWAQFGALPSAGDVSTNIQSFFDYMAATGGTGTGQNGDHATTVTITVTHSTPFKMIMPSDCIIVSSVTAGDFAVDFVGGLFNDIECRVENSDSTANGIRLGAPVTGGADNSLYHNVLLRAQNQGGRSATKPAVGSGTVGILFRNVVPVSGDSNFFHNLLPGSRARGYDNGIWLAKGANANHLLYPQVELYWYGIHMEADECHVLGGFGHASVGTSSSVATDAILLRDGTVFNTVDRFLAEPGATFSRAANIEPLAIGNDINIIDNAPLASINLGSNNGAIDDFKTLSYSYTQLTENTYYRLSKFTLSTNIRKAFIDIRWDSHNATTAGRSAGEAKAVISRDGAGVVTAEIFQDSKSRTGAGAIELRGFDIDGDTAYPNFFVVDNGSATSNTTVNMDIYASVSGGAARREQTVTVTPTTGLANNVADATAFTKLAVGSVGDPLSGWNSQNYAAINFGSIAAGASSPATRTVTGAVLGDTVLVSSDVNLSNGAPLYAKVSAADTVIVELYNHTGAPYDPPSFVPRITIIKN